MIIKIILIFLNSIRVQNIIHFDKHQKGLKDEFYDFSILFFLLVENINL
jgi:hypothetical protein